MSSATGDYLTRHPASRPVRLIAAVAALEALTFALADASAFGGFGADLPWILLDFYLLRRIWRGNHTAWCVLVTLNVGTIVLCTLTLFEHNLHVDGGPLLLPRIGLELALLAAPAMRRWVGQG